jgi:hypothetical protein
MDRRMLELREVTQFDRRAPGWAEWRDGVLRGPKDEFSFFEGDEEVARARIYPKYRLYAPYEGLRPGLFVDIDLVVVREDRRGAGIGPDVVALLVSHYQGQEMIAFSAADGLWVKAGWIRAFRRDGDDLAWPLFIHPVNSGRY